MRVFLAVELASIAPAVDAAAAALRAAFSTLGPAVDRGVSWSRTRPPHATLHFLGEQPEPRVAALVRACEAPWPVPRFVATFGGVGTFPRLGPVRVLWLGCREGTDALAALQVAAAQRLRAIGIPTEPGPFTPHVTIGRLRDRAPLGLRACLPAEIPGAAATCAVDAVTLFRSRLSPSGSTYDVLARGRLQP